MNTRMSLAFLALAVVSVSAQNEAPGSEPMEEVHCVQNEDCQKLMDTNATCSEIGLCACTDGFTGEYCMAPHVSDDEQVIRLTFTWENANCEEHSEPLKTLMEQQLAEKLPGIPFTVEILCGSVHGLVKATTAAANISATIMSAQAAARNATDTRGLSQPTVQLGLGDQACTLENADETTRLADDVCYPVRCSPGFERVQVASRWECRLIKVPVVHRDGDDDDDLSKSAIAAIVVGCVLFVAIIGAAVYLLTAGKQSGEEEPQNYENAPDGVNDVNV